MSSWWGSLDAVSSFNNWMRLIAVICTVMAAVAGIFIWFSANRISVLQKVKEAEGAKREQAARAMLEEVTFGDSIEQCTLIFGGNTATYRLEELRTPKMPFKMEGVMPTVYAEGNKFYADVTIHDSSSAPAIEIKHNKPTITPPRWDYNKNSRAFEVVNENLDIVFQIIYSQPSKIVINGIFPRQDFKDELLYVSESGIIGGLIGQPPPDGFTLRRIFKYPAWKFPGQYEESATH
jgi:hypothetical protein